MFVWRPLGCCVEADSGKALKLNDGLLWKKLIFPAAEVILERSGEGPKLGLKPGTTPSRYCDAISKSNLARSSVFDKIIGGLAITTGD